MARHAPVAVGESNRVRLTDSIDGHPERRAIAPMGHHAGDTARGGVARTVNLLTDGGLAVGT